MAISTEQLVAVFEARMNNYEKQLNKVLGVTNKTFKGIEKRADTLSKKLETSGQDAFRPLVSGAVRAGAAIAAGLFGGDVVQAVKNLSDSATKIDNALKVAGLSGDELEAVYSSLSDAAKENGAPIEALVALYGRAAIVQKELGVSGQELLSFTKNVAVALRVAGTDAASASGALLQLSQALGSGTVRAEEFNSILEGALPIAQAAAAGLKEAGGSVATLRGLVVDGAISSEAFFRAFEAGSVILEQKVASSTFTVSQATTNLYTALIDVAREFNQSTGAGERFAGSLNAVAEAISNADVSGFISKLQSMRAEFDSFLNDIGNADIFRQLNELMGVTEGGVPINVDKTKADAEVADMEARIAALQERIALNTSLGFDNTDSLAALAEVQAALAQVRATAASLPATVEKLKITSDGLVGDYGETNGLMGGPTTRGGPRGTQVVTPVSLTDFTPPSSSTKNTRGGGANSLNAYQSEIQQIQQRTDALRGQTAAQASVNPLIDDYGYTLEKAKVEQELLSSAQKANVALTPEVKAQISTLAEGYARASAAAKQLAEEQQNVRETMDFAKDAANGFLSDLRQGLEDGKLTWKDFGNAALNVLNKIIDKIQGQLVDALFSMGSTTGGTGIFGMLFGGLAAGATGGGGGGFAYAKGTQYAPGGMAIVGERGPELVKLPTGSQVIPGGRISGALAGGNGGSISFSSSMHITVGGTGDKELLQRVRVAGETAMRSQLEKFSNDVLPRRMRSIAADPRKVGR